MINAIITDIEGTTSSIAFVKEVLFPYAAKRFPDFLADHWDHPCVQEQIKAAEKESGETLGSADKAAALFLRWIEEDRKATPLKTLQGMIWKAGYENGDYTAHMYPDTAPALKKWHQKGIALYVYSSGSITAQKLFFGYSDAGDLTGLLSGYFDTTTGPKQETDSYRKIQQAIDKPANTLLFLSDIEAELDAAAEAGFNTCLLDRQQAGLESRHPVASNFNHINLAD
ncbi:MAG: haloacid dehalogenase [Alcanivorax borkumensis]|jgi:enolase-phosphatase E1|uniref:Enolase-phosphatase E1 n=1 Tax=Alcanivorax borkumensis (strain ATCC 700651 / DSM 11573 / NCIMB 13689 / SK2) TaxID=393595 RepID=MTNC_ALCBS|nr:MULTISPECIES: acireductone synthase [Alcanivorax]Q0VPK3.2 RecName: Full=Enolase-phosphatase E1; AltName: Full=2,3-diketo-5-methylthio-1-phosphopentane phosphatase [Alcanivorax borkumensis SK2]OJH08971.1 MAG: haloacid dehalogenase [Alcanivorax borkumensis]BAP14346.1 enolase [Alcanivorax sp. NBRC 101098]